MRAVAEQSDVLADSQASRFAKSTECPVEVAPPDIGANPPTVFRIQGFEVGSPRMDGLPAAGDKGTLPRLHGCELFDAFRCDNRQGVDKLNEHVTQRGGAEFFPKKD
jgi:hypothetical protein